VGNTFKCVDVNIENFNIKIGRLLVMANVKRSNFIEGEETEKPNFLAQITTW